MEEQYLSQMFHKDFESESDQESQVQQQQQQQEEDKKNKVSLFSQNPTKEDLICTLMESLACELRELIQLKKQIETLASSDDAYCSVLVVIDQTLETLLKKINHTEAQLLEGL